MDFETVQKRARELQTLYARRDTLFERMEDMFHLRWAEGANLSKRDMAIRLTVNPAPRQALLGAARILAGTDPIISVEEDEDRGIGPSVADKLERFISGVLKVVGEVRQSPVHFDIVLSLLLYGEAHVLVEDMKDLVASTRDKRVERLARRTPVFVRVMNPKYGYPDFDDFGLRAYYRRAEMRISEIKALYPDAPQGSIPEGSDTRKVTLHEYWDSEVKIAWVQGGKMPVFEGEHGLDEVPVLVAIGEGSALFDEPDEQRQPFLLGVVNSGLWERSNLSLTAFYTLLFLFASNPKLVFRRGRPDRELEVDWTTLGGLVTLDQGDELDVLGGERWISNDILQGNQLADQLMETATIYRQTLGEPIGTRTPFSAVALLSQAGRLPLVIPVRKANGLLTGIAYRILNAARRRDIARVDYQGVPVVLDQVPETVSLSVRLDVRMPQDNLQLANIAAILADRDLVSRRWLAEHILNITDYSKVQEDAVREKFTDAFLSVELQQIIQELQQAAAGAGQAGPTSPQPGQSPPPPQTPPGPPPGRPVPPDMGTAKGPGFAPPLGGLPPQQAGMVQAVEPPINPGGRPPNEEGKL